MEDAGWVEADEFADEDPAYWTEPYRSRWQRFKMWLGPWRLTGGGRQPA